MPDHPALAATVLALVGNPLDQPFDAKYLLIASNNLASLLIEQGEVASNLQQPGRREQADKQLILAGQR
ncbi:hypothetical protein D9M71_681160 [compost metagenome]